MANELSVLYPTPSLSRIYFTINDSAGRWWNGTAFEAADASHWGSYAIEGADAAGIGQYLASMPAAPPGYVSARAWLMAGGSAAPTDRPPIAGSDRFWDGTTLSYLPNPLPVNSLPLSAFAPDTRVDGTCRAGSTPTVINLGASDPVAADFLAASAGALTGVAITIQAGTGMGSTIPIGSVAPGPVAHVASGSTAPALDATSQYTWDLAVPATVADPLAVVGAAEPGETGYQTLRLLRAEAMGHWDTTTNPGYATYFRKDGTTEAFRAPLPTTTARPNATLGGGL